jgi:pantetheine-phosphate adenylyltransferase
MNKKAIYAGTFDPITRGHLDVIERAARIFPSLIVVVADNPDKKQLFSVEERVALVTETVKDLSNIRVDRSDGLLVDYARKAGALVIIRGLRLLSDFEYEFQMALTNRRLAPDIETLFLMPKQDYSYISSTNIRQVAELGGDVSEFVPAVVAKALENKFRNKA